MNIRVLLLATTGSLILTLTLATRADDWLNQKSDLITVINELPAGQSRNDVQRFEPVIGAKPIRRYPFPAKRDDLDVGSYWQVTGHSNGHKRDLSATRFNPESGSWTSNHPASEGLSGDARKLIWDTPVYAPASGVVLTCWRNAPDGYDIGEIGCGDDTDSGLGCRTPGGGNHLRIWIPDEQRVIHLAHFRQGSVPSHLCPHNATHVEDWYDKSGAFGYNPDIVVPFQSRWVEEGELIGHVGNSGRSGNPHLHMQLSQCESSPDRDNCHIIAMHFKGASIAQKTAGRDVRDDEWLRLNGELPVTSPRYLVLPDHDELGFAPNNSALLSQASDASVTVVLDVNNPWAPTNQFDWKKTDPSTALLEQQLTLDWNIGAYCNSGIESIQIDSPGGAQIQSYEQDTYSVNGTFQSQSFSTEEIVSYCLDWAEAESNNKLCNQAPEVCHNSDMSNDLVGGVDNGLTESELELRVQCRNGETIVRKGSPSLALTCGAIPFGFVH